jgi:serine/threonine-protein kinase RsbW
MVSTLPVVLHAGGADEDGVILLTHEPGAVPAARRLLTGQLAGHAAVLPVVDEVAVVVSELLANAVRHGRPIGRADLLLRWRVEGDGVEVSVVDGGGGGDVRVPAPDPEATSGRGMHIVTALARAWGTSEDAHGRRTVWATVALPGDGPGADRAEDLAADLTADRAGATA